MNDWFASRRIAEKSAAETSRIQRDLSKLQQVSAELYLTPS